MAITTVTSGSSQAWSLPNLLTYAGWRRCPSCRLPLLVGHWMGALGRARHFIAAGITDFLDGYLARALSQQSTFGQMLDPIADKLLVRPFS